MKRVPEEIFPFLLSFCVFILLQKIIFVHKRIDTGQRIRFDQLVIRRREEFVERIRPKKQLVVLEERTLDGVANRGENTAHLIGQHVHVDILQIFRMPFDQRWRRRRRQRFDQRIRFGRRHEQRFGADLRFFRWSTDRSFRRCRRATLQIGRRRTRRIVGVDRFGEFPFFRRFTNRRGVAAVRLLKFVVRMRRINAGHRHA